MVKYICDYCGDEITKNMVQDRLYVCALGRGKTPAHRIHAEVIVGVDGIWNKGELCERCVRELVASGQWADTRGFPEIMEPHTNGGNRT